MKKYIFLFLFVLILPIAGMAQTMNLSGSSITLEVVSLADSAAVLTDFISATGDSLTATHSSLTARTKTLSDSVTAGHTALTARTKTLSDSVTAGHTALTARIKTLADSLTSVHSKLETLDSGIFHEQADAAVNITAIADSGITVLNLRTANTRYVIRNLRLKCADPGANTVTITLWKFINDAFIAIDTFAITTLNYTSYFSLQDMFGEPQIAGDNIMIMAQTDAGTAAITGQYSYAKTNK